MKTLLALVTSYLAVACSLANGQSLVYPVGNQSARPTALPSNSNGYQITRRFSEPRKDGALHSGVDLGNGAEGGVVRSVGAGTVVLTLPELQSSGFGNVVLIRHDLTDGTIYSLYGHLQNGSVVVSAGNTVFAGQTIAAVDCTGGTEGTSLCPSNGRSGSHLHFAMKRTAGLGCGYISSKCSSEPSLAGFVDPLAFIAARSQSAASIFADTFESYTNGTFPSSGGWVFRAGSTGSGSGNQFVSNSVARAGAQSFRLQSAQGLGVIVQHTFAVPTNRYAIEAYVNTSRTDSKNVIVGFMNNNDFHAGVHFRPSGVIGAFNFNTSATSFISLSGTYTANTWIKLRVEVNPTLNTFAVYKDGILIGQNLPVTTAEGVINRMAIAVDNSGVGVAGGTTVYFDDVQILDLGP